MSKNFNDSRIDPRRSFFLAINVCNDDGTLDLGAETPCGFATIEDAVEHASAEADDNGGEVFVYECRPARRVRRHTVLVEDLS